jgi:ubiquinone/menaquinone biosynthesis C-methylase UbiE
MRGIEHVPWLYDAIMGILDALGLRRWRQELVRGARGRTLEVGCGTGRNLSLYPRDVQVIGLEPDAGAIARAQRRSPTTPLVIGTVEALPFRTAEFDTVVSSLVFCSVDDPVLGLKEVRRVLRGGGELRMLEHVRATSAAWAAWQDRIQPLWTRLTGGCHPNRNTESLVEGTGFCIPQTDGSDNHVLRRFSAHPVA